MTHVDTTMTHKIIGDDTEKETGNTRNRSRTWCFTYNNYTNIELSILHELFDTETQQFIFQEEKGAEGTPHLQGAVKYKNARAFSSMRRINPKIHWERCKSWLASVEYCSKIESRVGKIYTNIEGIRIVEPIVDKFKLLIPRKWQEICLNIIKNPVPDPRAVHWFYEEKGNTGKSLLARHLVLEYGALLVSGKAADIKFAFTKMKIKPKIVIIDIPRSYANYFTYTIIEELKNGLFFSGKYEGEMVVFNTPHVIVFSNSEPNYDELSEDRWDIHPIDEI